MLARLVGEAGYWQFSPRPAGAANAGSAPGRGAAAADVVGVLVAAAFSLPESRLVMTTVATTAATTTIAATAEPTIV